MHHLIFVRLLGQIGAHLQWIGALNLNYSVRGSRDKLVSLVRELHALYTGLLRVFYAFLYYVYYLIALLFGLLHFAHKQVQLHPRIVGADRLLLFKGLPQKCEQSTRRRRPQLRRNQFAHLLPAFLPGEPVVLYLTRIHSNLPAQVLNPQIPLHLLLLHLRGCNDLSRDGHCSLNIAEFYELVAD